MQDFIVEDTLWGLQDVVVALDCGPGRLVLMPPNAVRSISWKGHQARVDLRFTEVEHSPDFDPTAPVNHDVDDCVYDYYGRPLTGRS